MRKKLNCRQISGSPLFWVMQHLVHCKGSKITHISNGGMYDLSSPKYGIFMFVMRRLFRDKPLPADEASVLIHKLSMKYGPRISALSGRGFDFVQWPHQLIGELRLVNGDFVYHRNREIALLRGIEFSKPKYKKLAADHLGFLKSLFELTELTKTVKRK